MGDTVVGHHALQQGTTGLTFTPPAGSAAGDLEVLVVFDKLVATLPTSPPPAGSSGTWILHGQQAVGTGADGAGVGQILCSVWKRVLTAASGNTTVSIPSGDSAMGGGTIFHKLAGDPAWNLKVSFGTDSSSGTGFSATVAVNLDIKVGEFVVSFGAFTAQTTLPGRGLTLPGVTSTLTGIDSGGTANGNDMFVWRDMRQSTAGTQSGAGTTTATAGVATTGGCVHYQASHVAGITQAILPAAETDAAQPIGRQKIRALGIVTETDTGQTLGRRKTRAVLTAAESDAAQPVTRSKRRALGIATTLDAAIAVTRSKRRPIGTATETDLASPIFNGRVVLVGPAFEVDQAQPIGRRKIRQLGPALEVDAGQAIGRVKVRLVGVALEVDEAMPVMTLAGMTLDLDLSGEVEPDRYDTGVEPDRYTGDVEPDRYAGRIEP